jgi:hypothetical protein
MSVEVTRVVKENLHVVEVKSEGEYMTVAELESRYNLRRKMGYHLISEGLIPHECVLRLGRLIRINRRKLSEWENGAGK